MNPSFRNLWIQQQRLANECIIDSIFNYAFSYKSIKYGWKGDSLKHSNAIKIFSSCNISQNLVNPCQTNLRLMSYLFLNPTKKKFQWPLTQKFQTQPHLLLKKKITPWQISFECSFLILRKRQLLKNPKVLFAGYKVPHPLEHNFLLKIQVTPDTSPKEVFAIELEKLKKHVQDLSRKFRVIFICIILVWTDCTRSSIGLIKLYWVRQSLDCTKRLKKFMQELNSTFSKIFKI